jgi:ribonuclease E
MARAKSTSGSKPITNANTTKEQAPVTSPANSPAVSAPVVHTPVAQSPVPQAPAALASDLQGKAQEKVPAHAQSIAPAAAPVASKAAPEPRKKLEVVKTEPRRVVPINVEEEIRRRAYELYQQRGARPGGEREDWLEAEREVRQRYKQQSA